MVYPGMNRTSNGILHTLRQIIVTGHCTSGNNSPGSLGNGPGKKKDYAGVSDRRRRSVPVPDNFLSSQGIRCDFL